MPDINKNIIITPNRGLSGQPEIFFGGSGGVPIRMKVLDDSFGTLSWEGSAGQLFSINNNLTSGSIFSVNDVSGIPSIDVNANGTVSIAGFTGNVGLGLTAPTAKLHVVGSGIFTTGISASGVFASGSTFAGLVTMTSGVSAAGGITFNGAITGVTATFTRLLTANAGISASGITLPGNARINFNGGDGLIDSTAYLRLGENSLRVFIGAAGGGGNQTGVFIRDAASILDITNPFGTINIGDPGGQNTSTYIAVNSDAAQIDICGETYQQTGDFTSGGRVTGQSGVAIGAAAISAKTSGYTLTANDNGKVITFNSASALVCGIGTASGATGFSCTIIQLGTGGVRFAASGVTLNSFNGLTLAGQHASASVVCYQTNVLNVSGNLIG